MKRYRDILGQPVVELREGRSLGRVYGLLVNAMARRVEALEVGERSLLKSKRELVPFAKIRSIGNDAVTLADGEAIQEEGQQPEVDQFPERKLEGNRVMTADGTLVGRIEDFSFSAQSGELLDIYVISEKERLHLVLPVSVIENIGRDFTIVSEDYLSQAKEMEPDMERPGKAFSRSLEMRAIDLALGRETGQDVLDEAGEIIVRKGEKVTHEVIELAKKTNRLAHVLMAAGVGELLDGLDYTKEKLDTGSRKLLETWHILRDRSQEWLSRKIEEDRPSPTGELRSLWFQLQGMLTQSGRELEETTRQKIKLYVEGKLLTYPVYDDSGHLLAKEGEAVSADTIAAAEAAGRLPQLFLSSAASEVKQALDPVKNQIKDLLQGWDK